MKWKESPKIKIYEALTVMANGRVKVDGNTAKVSSSAGKRVYDVNFDPDKRAITANDNGSFWQGYMGYPMIAFLMAISEIKYDQAVAESLKDINWGYLNEKFKRKYDRVIEYVLSEATKKGGDAGKVRSEVAKIGMQLRELDLERLPNEQKPPV